MGGHSTTIQQSTYGRRVPAFAPDPYSYGFYSVRWAIGVRGCWFGVPPQMIGDASKQTFANYEQAGTIFCNCRFCHGWCALSRELTQAPQSCRRRLCSPVPQFVRISRLSTAHFPWAAVGLVVSPLDRNGPDRARGRFAAHEYGAIERRCTTGYAARNAPGKSSEN